MKVAHPLHVRASRFTWRVLTATLSLAMLAGGLGLSARVQAQDTAKKADTADKTNKTDSAAKKPDNKKANSILDDDTINQDQAIKPGFVVSVNVVGEAEPSGSYQVDQSGNIGIKYAGIMTNVSVVGLTPTQAKDVVTKMLAVYIKNPSVTVTITQVPRPTVFVNGAVVNQGPLSVTQDVTLIDVLSKAVWTENADLTQVTVIHKEKDGDKEKSVSKIYNFELFLKPGKGVTPDETNNPVLQDKDRVIVPLKIAPSQGNIGVGGQVIRPQRDIPLRNGQMMTVREAINLVGGTLPDANRKAISVRRQGVDRLLIVDLDKAEQGDLVNNIELRPDDTIYVEKLENNAYINMNGGFIRPGKLVFDKRTTLLQAIMEAGGPAPYSKETKGIVFRHPTNDPKQSQPIKFNFRAMRDGKQPDIDLQPGDSVWIEGGQPPKPPLDLFGALGALTSGAYLFNTFTGRRFY